MDTLSVTHIAPVSRFNNADLAGTAVQIMLDVSESVRALRAAQEGNPLEAGSLSFYENFAEALQIEADKPLTADLLPSVFSLGIESESDEKHIRFSVPEGMTAELAESGPSVALRIASLEAPQSPILLIHEDFRSYADFVRPGLFANPSVSPEKDALLRILCEANNKLDRWIDGMRIKEVLNAPDTETSYRLCDEQCWTWENWDLFCSDADNAEALRKHIFAAGASKGEIARALRNLNSSLWLAGEFRSLFAPLAQTFARN